MSFPFYGQDGYLRSTVVNVFDKFCLKLVSRQFIQIKILFLIQLFLLLIGSQLITFQLLEFQFIIHASLLSAYRQAGCFPLPQSMRHFL